MGRKKPQVKKGKPKAAKNARTVPPPEPYVPTWGEVNPDFYEDLLEWVDVSEID